MDRGRDIARWEMSAAGVARYGGEYGGGERGGGVAEGQPARSGIVTPRTMKRLDCMPEDDKAAGASITTPQLEENKSRDLVHATH